MPTSRPYLRILCLLQKSTVPVKITPPLTIVTSAIQKPTASTRRKASSGRKVLVPALLRFTKISRFPAVALQPKSPQAASNLVSKQSIQAPKVNPKVSKMYRSLAPTPDSHNTNDTIRLKLMTVPTRPSAFLTMPDPQLISKLFW